MVIFCVILLLLPSVVLSDVIVHDLIVIKGENIMLKAETRGKFFRQGGRMVEFFINGKSVGKSLSGGDGFAFKQFTPLNIGFYKITTRSDKEEDNGLLLSLKRGTKIVFIDVEGSLFEGLFSKKPRTGSQKVIKTILGRFPVVFLQTGFIGIKDIKIWLKENGFIASTVLPWNEGIIFDEINEKGLKIRAVIGSPSVIESAMDHKPEAFSFEEIEDADNVRDWEDIGRKLR